MIRFKELWHHFGRYLKLFKAIYKDKRTPKVSKVLLWIAIGYFVLPIDLIPDFIPVLGQLDDLIIVPCFVMLALKFVPTEVYNDNYRKIFHKKA